MKDAELTAAVALKVGWKKREVKASDSNTDLHWLDLYGNPSEAPWLTSVDAALGVLDKSELFNLHWVGTDAQVWHVFYGTAESSNKSLPRAILLAFLESQEEKP